MAQPNDASEPQLPPFAVRGTQFIEPQKLKVIVEKYPGGNLVVSDVNHKIILKVKPYNKIFHRQRVLLDADDNRIAKLRQKKLSPHSRWNVYRGEGKASSDIIFTAKRTQMFQWKCKTDVSVMLPNNMTSKCDLRIKGGWLKRNCTIYRGNSSKQVAEMHEPLEPQTVKYAKDKFTVTIQANMDYACVVALLAIVDAMKNPDEKNGSCEALGCAGNVGGGVLSVVSN